MTTRYTDLDDVEIKVNKDEIFKIAVRLISSYVPKDKIAEAFNIKPSKEKDALQLLVEAGKASNYFEAAVLVGQRFKPEGGSTWNQLAKWVAEYEAHEKRKLN